MPQSIKSHFACRHHPSKPTHFSLVVLLILCSKWHHTQPSECLELAAQCNSKENGCAKIYQFVVNMLACSRKSNQTTSDHQNQKRTRKEKVKKSNKTKNKCRLSKCLDQKETQCSWFGISLIFRFSSVIGSFKFYGYFSFLVHVVVVIFFVQFYDETFN
jgi:hypothetical protein